MTTERTIKESLCKGILVVAIDIGTTHSAYALSFRTEPFQLLTNPQCFFKLICGYSMKWTKILTVLLLDENKKFVAFGYKAKELYDQLLVDGTHGNHYYCRRFKISLHTSAIMDINCKITDVNGTEVEALIVFRESIKYLKKEAEDFICKRACLENAIIPNDIEWVLTVPAMWTDAAKQFMRKAAEKAGIKNEKLNIALEPEAASILYMHMNCIKKDETDNEVQIDRGFQHGAIYLVVDMGGGTVDITLYQVEDETSLRELAPPCRGHCGGTTVDENYVTLLESITGKDVFKCFAEENKVALVELYEAFEFYKRYFGHECSNSKHKTNKTTMYVPGTLKYTMKTMYPAKSFDKVIERDDQLRGKVTWKRDKITINSDLFASFFKTTLEGTMNEIEKVLRNSADVEAILLVGGCAESPLIYQRVKSRFPE